MRTAHLLLTILSLITSTTSFAQDLKSGGVLKPEQANMDIRHYTWVMKVDPAQQRWDGYTEIALNLKKASNKLLFDLWSGYTIKEIKVNDKVVPYSHEKNLIHIVGATDWNAGATKVKVTYGGKPGIAERAPWTGGIQWDKDSKGNPFIALTCQGEGAQIFFPCKDHPSDEPNEGVDMIITVPKGLVAAGPGLLQSQKTKGDQTTYHWKTNYTISNYCIVFNVGKYVTVTRDYTSVDGNKIPMVYYVLEENKEKAPHLLEMMEVTCRVLEKYFGEYPFAKEKIGLCETPHLGMEHQTNVAYGNKYRYTTVGGKDCDWLLNHEFGHEWWANKVSNIDWAHMWIQEGICTYGDNLYYLELEGEASYLNKMQNIARTLNSNIPVVRGEEVDSDSAYKAPIYAKGAFFMHSLRFVVGDEVFFPTLKKLATAPQYTYDNMVHTNDVEALFSNASGIDLKPFFNFFLRTANKLEFLVKENQANSYFISLRNIDMPLPVMIKTDAGIKRVMLDKKGMTVKSSTTPVIDPDIYYLKRVILE